MFVLLECWLFGSEFSFGRGKRKTESPVSCMPVYVCSRWSKKTCVTKYSQVDYEVGRSSMLLVLVVSCLFRHGLGGVSLHLLWLHFRAPTCNTCVAG